MAYRYHFGEQEQKQALAFICRAFPAEADVQHGFLYLERSFSSLLATLFNFIITLIGGISIGLL